MDFRKQAKESRAKKLHQMTVKAPDAKVDASDFQPYADPNMDKKTGKRPINPRNFKRGGKVAALDGAKAAKRGDRMGAKGRKAKQMGGDISADDKARLSAMAAEAAKEKPKQQAPKAANVPLPPRREEEAPKFRAKEEIMSPYKKGGRTKKADGGGDDSWRPSTLIKRPLEDDSPRERPTFRDTEKSKTFGGDNPDYRKPKINPISGRPMQKSGGRTKKMMGGDITAGGNPQIPSAKGQTSLLRKAVGLDYKKGGKVEKMNGGPMMAAPSQTLMKRKTPMNNPAAKAPAVVPMRAKGGEVHSDEAMDKALIKKMVKPEARKEKKSGGRACKADGGSKLSNSYTIGQAKAMDAAMKEAQREKKAKQINESLTSSQLKRGGRTERMARKSGGRAKGKTNISIIVAPQPAAQGAMPALGAMPPRPPMPMPMPPAPGGMPPGGMPPGAMGGAMPIPVPMPMGGAPAPQGAGVPGLPGMAPLPRKSGGRVKSFKDMTAGAGSGEGRLQKEEMQEYKRTARKAGGKVPSMTAGAGSGPGRIEKIHAYGENPHGEAAPKPQKRKIV